jgi:hypothetical protein
MVPSFKNGCNIVSRMESNASIAILGPILCPMKFIGSTCKDPLCNLISEMRLIKTGV